MSKMATKPPSGEGGCAVQRSLRELGRIAQLRLCAISIKVRLQPKQMSRSTANAQSPNSECHGGGRARETDSYVDVGTHEPYRVDDRYREGNEKEDCQEN